jgi:hypothetical protein
MLIFNNMSEIDSRHRYYAAMPLYIAVDMEDRPLLILGSDLPISTLVRELCLVGIGKILVVDAHIEPGGYLGTQHSVGFRYEKLPLLIPESSSKIFEKHGFEMACRDIRVWIAKHGDHIPKAMCWKKSDLKPWWYPELGERLCYPRRGWGSAIRSMVSGKCSEYTFYLPRKVDIARRIAVLRNGRVIRYRLLVSSLPLPILLESLYSEEKGKEIRGLMQSLDWVDMLNISLGVRGKPPEYEIVLHGTRASRTHTFYIWSNIDPTSSPPEHYLVEMLMSYCREHPPPTDQVSRGFAEARWAKLVSSRESVVSERVYTIPYIQPITADRDLLKNIHDYLRSSGIFLAGIGGLWENQSPEKQLKQGLAISREILSLI